MKRKKTKEYSLIIEGQCEQRYFAHMERIINTDERSKYRVKFYPYQGTPRSFAARSTHLDNSSISIPVFIDRESHDTGQKQTFENYLQEMSNVSKNRPNLGFDLMYSNPSFEVWLLLHASETVPPVHNCDQLVRNLIKAFSLKCPSAKEFKEQKYFTQFLENIDLQAICQAVSRAERLENDRKKIDKMRYVAGYGYYEQNPATFVHRFVKPLLELCGLYPFRHL